MEDPHLAELAAELREARAILGDALMGMGAAHDDDGKKPGPPSTKWRIRKAFTSADNAIEQIELLIGLPPRSLPEDWMLTMQEVAACEPTLAKKFTRASEKILRTLREREHAATRPPDFKGLLADQRMSALEIARELLSKALITGSRRREAADDDEWAMHLCTAIDHLDALKSVLAAAQRSRQRVRARGDNPRPSQLH